MLFFFKSLKEKFLYLFFLLLLLGNSLYSQNTEKTYVTVLPYSTIMEINGDTIALTKENQPYVIELEPGEHSIRLWAPGYYVFHDTLQISKNIKNKYAKLLSEKTREFQDFEISNFTYQKKIKSRKIKKTALVTTGALLSICAIDSKRFEIIKYKRKANKAYHNYNSSTTIRNLDAEYENYFEAKAKHDKVVKSAKKRLKYGIPIAIVISIGTWLQIKKINKKKMPPKPSFSPKYPFNKSNKKIGFTPFSKNNEVGLQIKF